jgi:hypothetical protein
MSDSEPLHDTALRSANLALSSRRHQEIRNFGIAEMRLDGPRTKAWEIVALASVAVVSTLVVIGVWFW